MLDTVDLGELWTYVLFLVFVLGMIAFLFVIPMQDRRYAEMIVRQAHAEADKDAERRRQRIASSKSPNNS